MAGARLTTLTFAGVHISCCIMAFSHLLCVFYKELETAGWSLVKYTFPVCRRCSQVPVISQLKSLISPSRQASAAAWFLHTVCQFALSHFLVLSILCSEHAATGRQPVPDRSLWSFNHLQGLTFSRSPPSHVKKLSSPPSHATCRDIPLVPLWNISKKGNFWWLTAAEYSLLSVRVALSWNGNLLQNGPPWKTERWSESNNKWSRHGCRII